jgi:hypothetical protein
MIGVGGRGELHSPIGRERVRISLFGRWVFTEDIEKRRKNEKQRGRKRNRM